MSGPHGPHFGTLRKWRFAGEIDYAEGADAFGCADGLEFLLWGSPEAREEGRRGSRPHRCLRRTWRSSEAQDGHLGHRLDTLGRPQIA
jgi:hypothetical protein